MRVDHIVCGAADVIKKKFKRIGAGAATSSLVRRREAQQRTHHKELMRI